MFDSKIFVIISVIVWGVDIFTVRLRDLDEYEYQERVIVHMNAASHLFSIANLAYS